MEILTHNPTSLAWIGDAIYTLAVRRHLLEQGFQKPALLEQKQARYNSAKSQARFLDILLEKEYFLPEEQEILRRGRNASLHTKAKNADIETYRKATALEALIGYLDLYKHQQRLEQLLDQIITMGDDL